MSEFQMTRLHTNKLVSKYNKYIGLNISWKIGWYIYAIGLIQN